LPERPARFAIGEPIAVGDDGQAAHRQVMAFIEARIEEWASAPSTQPEAEPGLALHDPLAIRSDPGHVAPTS